MCNANDALNITGPATLSGTLTVGAVACAPQGQYTVLVANGGLSGAFTTTNLPPAYGPVYTSTTVVIRVS